MRQTKPMDIKQVRKIAADATGLTALTSLQQGNETTIPE